jgi:hypothetical protein
MKGAGMTHRLAGNGNRARPTRNNFTPKMTRLLTAFILAVQLTFPMTAEAIADDTSGFKTVAGVSVYIGLMPAEIVKGHPSGHPEAEMHSGVPNGPHAYHLIVALFDEQNGAKRIEDARIAATVSGVGHVGQSNVALEPMLIADTITYGAFIDLKAMERFEIALTITVPDRPEPVRVEFENQHLP